MAFFRANRIVGTLFAVLVTGLAASVAQSPGKVQVDAFVTSSKNDTPRSTLASTTPRVYVIYMTKGVIAGDKFRGVLMADHTDRISPENRKVNEAKAILDGDTEGGAISFSKPINDWPIGDYHVEIYINEKLAAIAKFTIEPAK